MVFCKFISTLSFVPPSTLLLPILLLPCCYSEDLHFVVNTTDGCRYVYRAANSRSYTTEFPRPSFCKRLLPDNDVLSKTPETGPHPFTLKLYYTQEKDVFRLKISSKKNISMYEAWVTTKKANIRSNIPFPVGQFLPGFNYERLCCDWTELRTSVRYNSEFDTRVANTLFESAHIFWSPLHFVGQFRFVANILISEEKWYKEVSSRVYRMPAPVADFQQKDELEMSSHLQTYMDEESFLPQYG